MSRTKPPKSDAKKSAGEKAFARTRWLYQEDGCDLGPFKPDEIRELLKDGTIGPDSLIRETNQRRWHPVKRVRVFIQDLREIRADRERQAEEHVLNREESRVRTRGRGPKYALMTVATVLVVGGLGVGITWVYGTDRGEASHLHDESLIRQIEVQAISKRALPIAAPPTLPRNTVVFRDGSTAKTKTVRKKRKTPRRQLAGNRKPKARSKTGKAPAVASADDLAPVKNTKMRVQDVSFDAPQGRQLSGSEVNSIVRRTTPRLIGCAQKEANRNTRFPGTTVRFAILPSGRGGGVRIGANGSRSRAFVRCVRSTVGRIRIEPFSGQSRIVRVPLKVGR